MTPDILHKTMAIARRLSWAGVALLLSVAPSLAHTGEAHEAGASWWTAWSFSPDIVLPAALVVAVYVVGARRRGDGSGAPPAWRSVAFLGGVAVVLIALQSPLDPLAERLFSLHQVQHLLLRMLGPMLIALAWPAPCLVAGLPAGLRRGVLAPGLGSGVLRGVFGVIAQPLVATVIFIAALYLWEIPAAHNAALLDEPLHYLMHVTMLAAGVLFWWRIFDRRPPPQGARYGLRVALLVLVIFSNIALGAFTTLKGEVLYTAYDVAGRLNDYPALGDEQIGGVVIWVPGSMMCLIAALVVIHLWGCHENRVDDRRLRWPSSGGAALAVPTTAAEMIARQRPRNRLLALGFTAFVFTVFASAFVAGILDNRAHLAQPASTMPELHAAPAARMPKLN